MKHFALAGGLTAGLATVALAITYAGSPPDLFAHCRGDHGIAVNELGGRFTLMDENGQMVSSDELVTQPTLLYFGYTFCPDVCPMDNMRNAEAALMLEEDGVGVQTMFISVDPDRDTPEVLADFTDIFHADMIGLTGTAEQIAAVSEQFHTFYQIHEPDFDGYYLIDHSTYSYILMPEYGVVEVIERNDPAFDVADRAACIAAAAA